MRRLLPWLGLLVLTGCPKEGESLEDIDTKELGFQRRIVEKTTADGLVLEEIDVDLSQDPARAEIFNYYRERTGATRLLVRKELDLDANGVIDTRSYFNEAGELEREEMDRDFNGQFDWVDHYLRGDRVMTEFDSDGSGQADVFLYYTEGRITHKERDTTGNGAIDYWERYGDNGQVVKIGRDTDGDGKMDERE